ncbi:MAG TPA: hypothetical protein ENG30_02700 [Thermofilaceae archaeon]|nr:MAG: hypothetical protein DRJ43_03860 [Thermoprotei archaeon]HDD34040.1 hypothetical protein [Thermofilaceae archaeon]
MIAIADTCFLVNWLRYRDRERIFQAYSSIAVPLLVLDELGARGRAMLGGWLASRRVFLVPRVNEYEVEALRLVEYSHARRLPRIDPPEAYCLAVARRRGYHFLTDNKAPRYLVREVAEYRGVEVLDSLDLLVRLYGTGVELRRALAAYSEDTGLKFSRIRLREYGIEC